MIQRIDLVRRLELERAPALEVDGFAEDTLVRARARAARRGGRRRAALARADREADPGRRRARRRERRRGRRPRLANAHARRAARARARSLELAAAVGSDVPFFLEPGPKLAEGAGERLTPLELPQDYWVLVALAARRGKARPARSTAASTSSAAPAGFEERRAALTRVARRGRATSPRFRRTISPRRPAARARRRAARGRRVPRRRERRRARRSTRSSPSAAEAEAAAAALGAAADSGSTRPSGSVDP